METDPPSAENRVLALAKRGRPRAAIAVATIALRRRSDDAGLRITRALVHHSQREWAKSLRDVEHAMTLAPLPAPAQVVLGDCYWFTGKRSLAVLAFEHVARLCGESAETYAATYAGLVRAGRRDLALVCCRTAVETNPEDHAAWYAMAHCMVALDYDATYVASVLERAVGLSPDRDAYRLSLALQLTRCGRCDDAYRHVAAATSAALAELSCGCSVARLLRVCVQAGDRERSHTLANRLGVLKSLSPRQAED